MHAARFKKEIKKGSINNFSNSFIVNYLIFNSPVDEYLILSSKRCDEQIENKIKSEECKSRQVIKIDERFEIVQFEYKSEKSGLKINHRLNILKSIEEQDLLILKLCLNEVSRICSGSEDVKVEVLTQIVDLGIQVKLGTVSRSTEIIYKILKLKYNQKTVYKYQNRLSKLRQNDFHTIRAYVNEIDENCRKIG
ncbi:hypothetical protein DMUE_4347, partial [Dictyocoela muelleri]